MNVVRSSRVALCIAGAALFITGCGGGSDDNPDARTVAQVDTVEQPTTPAGPTVIKSKPKPPAPEAHPGVKVDQLKVKDLIKGTGAELEIGDTGVFDFVGAYYDTGKKLDSSWNRARPYETVIDNGIVIPGWAQGIPGMRVGGRRVLVIPSGLGFSPGAPNIRRGAPLYFVVDLRAVIPARSPGTSGS